MASSLNSKAARKRPAGPRPRVEARPGRLLRLLADGLLFLWRVRGGADGETQQAAPAGPAADAFP